MKFAHLADLHITEESNGHTDTLDEQVDRLLWIGDDMAQRGVQLILVAGDVFDSVSTPRERNAAIRVMRQWASAASIIIARGNHDRAGDLEYLGSIDVCTAIVACEQPRVLSITEDHRVYRIAVLPWPNKSGIASRVADLSLDTIDDTANAAMAAVLSWFKMQSPDILLAHCEIGASVLGAGQTLTGRADYPLSVDDVFDVGAKYAALGHIHDRQAWERDNGHAPRYVRYAGAPRQTKFSEAAEPGYTVVDIDDIGCVTFQHIPVPGRQLVTIGLNDHMGDCKDQAVKIKYTVRSDEREQVYAQAQVQRDQILTASAHSVCIEPKIQVTDRVRCDTITEVTTLPEQVEELWKLGERPARGDEIREKLGTIMEGT